MNKAIAGMRVKVKNYRWLSWYPHPIFDDEVMIDFNLSLNSSCRSFSFSPPSHSPLLITEPGYKWRASKSTEEYEGPTIEFNKDS
jgi:hypothetical protein